MTQQLFYRYEDRYLYNGRLEIVESTFSLLKETPCGYWIDERKDRLSFSLGRKHWISKTSRKRYAYPTKEEALESFKARKRRQILIIERQLEQAKEALFLVTGEKDFPDPRKRIYSRNYLDY